MNRRMPATETVRMALSTLRSNRLRSLLTMVGIVIGNASVITLVGVGRGAQLLAEGQLNNLGANVLFVVPGNTNARRQGLRDRKRSSWKMPKPSPPRFPASSAWRP